MYKYSYALNIVYVTFMFGAGIPILFVIAFLSLVSYYVLERILVAKYFKKPPMIDYKLNKQAINLMIIAPFLYCAIGFFMYNNPQTFDNSEITFAKTYGEPLGTN